VGIEAVEEEDVLKGIGRRSMKLRKNLRKEEF